jgi:hypothetical protein
MLLMKNKFFNNELLLFKLIKIKGEEVVI